MECNCKTAIISIGESLKLSSFLKCPTPNIKRSDRNILYSLIYERLIYFNTLHFNSLHFILVGFPDSGFNSLSTSSNRPATPMTNFELSALKVAIETIPEVDETRNGAFENARADRREKPRSSSEGAQETVCDWKDVREITRKIRPDSRSTLRAIDDLFYNRKGNAISRDSRVFWWHCR